MKTTSVARRYAQATFAVAQESGDPADWLQRLQSLAVTFGDRDVLATMRNPAISDTQKLDSLRGAFPDLPAPIFNLLRLLLERNRIDQLPAVAAAFAEHWDEVSGRAVADVISARTLSPDEVQSIESHLNRRTGKTVRLNASTNPDLIGGIILRIGDEVIDGSISTRLDRLRQRLA